MCGRYTNQRNDLLHDSNFIQNINLKLLLFVDVSEALKTKLGSSKLYKNLLEKQKVYLNHGISTKYILLMNIS